MAGRLLWIAASPMGAVAIRNLYSAIYRPCARNTVGDFGAGVARVAESIARRLARRAEMSLPVRIMAVKAGQPRWTMEEAE
jgi:hypothetical protein